MNDELYIKMCEAATQIQERWQHATLEDLPSLCWDKEIQRVCIAIWAPRTLQAKVCHADQNTIEVSIEHEKDLGHFTQHAQWSQCTIWLPYQHQLQAMVPNEGGHDIYIDFDKWFWDIAMEMDDISKFTVPADWCKDFSASQLWLAFVMHELYSKKWDGEKWQSK